MDVTATVPRAGNNPHTPVHFRDRYGKAAPLRRAFSGGALVIARILVALLMTSVLTTPSFAQTQPLDESQLQSTAVRALRWAFYYPNGYRWEYSGILVVTRDGTLRHSSAPSTLKQVDAVEMKVDNGREPGDLLVGLYHTHPCKSEQYFSQYFSPQDLVSAFFYHVPTFILDECTGEVHEFDPMHDNPGDTGAIVSVLRKDGSHHWMHLLGGRIVGDIGDTGPDLSAIEKVLNRQIY